MTHDDHDDNAKHSEPVLVTLSAPARKSLVADLVRPLNSAKSSAPTIDADIPDEELAAFLAGIPHTDTGYIARTESGERAVAVVAATVAAICGFDIIGALRNPDIDFVRSLKPPAIEATRTVLLAIETSSEAQLREALATFAP
ncbi:hypothetical protein [Nocardia camponoti]|uniref:Uncharacterized protein n=1 Tax=Nocardia camponoti TaxID=1616106 RepID=A0A917VAH5_9NOCA|nr:hypothetical protein [Nocardia camponoti]GGK55298.1 hypothetical protein GCM10011591_29040 [Nocardia camponoti]